MRVDYDPFAAGPFVVGVRTLELADVARGRRFPCELWFPAVGAPNSGVAVVEARGAEPRAGTRPLVVFSHLSGGHRRSSSFLCAHLASHGYAVAALDHSEVVAPELTRSPAETAAAAAARVERIIASRVPDVRLLLDWMVGDSMPVCGVVLDRSRVGLVGHSFGGWTALAAPDVDPRIRAVVAVAPGGGSQPRPGILPVTVSFAWSRDVPALFLTGDQDVMTPLDGVVELFHRCPAAKRMFILRRADHLHFLDDVENAHESLRRSELPGEAAWIPRAMRPLSELCPPHQAHTFARGLTLAHLDASLRNDPDAERFLAERAASALRDRSVDSCEYR